MEFDNQKIEQDNEVSPELASVGDALSQQDTSDRKEDDEEEEEEEEEDKIVEKSHNSRFHKRNKRFPKQIEGVDNAFVAIEPKSGKEVIWNECILPEKKTDKENRYLSLIKKLKKNSHPFLVRFLDAWVSKTEEGPRKLVFITERLDECTLKQFLCNSAKNNRLWNRHVGQLLSVLMFLHRLGVAHGNLTKESIYYQNSGNLRSFIEACFDTVSATKGLIKRLLNHPAVTEVPTLKLLSARMIVNSMISTSSEDGSTNEPTGFVSLLKEYLNRYEDETVIMEVHFPHDGVVKSKSWKDFRSNFTLTSKYLEDVKNGFYPLFGCHWDAYQGEEEDNTFSNYAGVSGYPSSNGLASNLSNTSGTVKNDSSTSVINPSTCTSTTSSACAACKTSTTTKLTDFPIGSQLTLEDHTVVQCEDASKGCSSSSANASQMGLANHTPLMNSTCVPKAIDNDIKNDDVSITVGEISSVISILKTDEDIHALPKTTSSVNTPRPLELGHAELKFPDKPFVSTLDCSNEGDSCGQTTSTLSEHDGCLSSPKEQNRPRLTPPISEQQFDFVDTKQSEVIHNSETYVQVFDSEWHDYERVADLFEASRCLNPVDRHNLVRLLALARHNCALIDGELQFPGPIASRQSNFDALELHEKLVALHLHQQAKERLTSRDSGLAKSSIHSSSATPNNESGPIATNNHDQNVSDILSIDRQINHVPITNEVQACAEHITQVQLHQRADQTQDRFLQARFGIPIDGRSTEELIAYDCRWRSRQPCRCLASIDGSLLPPCVEFPWLAPTGSLEVTDISANQNKLNKRDSLDTPPITEMFSSATTDPRTFDLSATAQAQTTQTNQSVSTSTSNSVNANTTSTTGNSSICFKPVLPCSNRHIRGAPITCCHGIHFPLIGIPNVSNSCINQSTDTGYIPSTDQSDPQSTTDKGSVGLTQETQQLPPSINDVSS
ncbi:Nuclear receptor-binding protein [Schistosoma japonicum]|nr:Nuclear receptor-binding protein [Schistosoma japonicum]